MANNEQKDLVQNRDLVPHEPLSVEKARVILQAVVSTHDASVIPQAPLDQMCGFSTEQIREAAAVVCEDLMSGDHMEAAGFYFLRKNLNCVGRIGANLILFRNYHREGNQYQIPYCSNGINLHVVTNDLYMQAQFPLVEPTSEVDKIRVYFRAYGEIPRDVNLHNSGKPLPLEDYRYLFRGMRWLFANMLEWEKPGIILPEQLDRLLLKVTTL